MITDNIPEIDGTMAFVWIGAVVALVGAYWLLPSTRARRAWKQLCEATDLEFDGRSFWNQEPVKKIPQIKRRKRQSYGFDLVVKLPKGAKPKDIVDEEDEIATAFGAIRVTSEQLRPKFVLIKVFKSDPLLDLREPKKGGVTTGGLKLPIAISESGSPLVIDLDQTPHLLFGGATGSGKSNAQNVLVSVLCEQGAEVVLIDLGEVDMAYWADLGLTVHTEIEESVQLLESMAAEMRERIQYVKRFGAVRMADLDVADRLPQKVVVVDEVQLLLHSGRDKASRELAARAESALFVLLSKSRKAGMAIVLATQRPGTDVIPARLRDLCSVRIAFRTETRDMTDVILGAGSSAMGAEAHLIPPLMPGTAIAKIDGRTFERVRFREFQPLHQSLGRL